MIKEYAKIPDLIHRALTYGINLDNLSRNERKKYLLNLSDYINKAGVFTSDYQDDRIVIESKYMDPIMIVRLKKGTLEFLPVAEGNFFDSFMTVLSFIANQSEEKELMKEFKIFIDEVDKEMIEEKETEEVEKLESEPTIPDPEPDDFDWI